MPAPVVDPSMRGYYERRADEYDDWWLGRGKFAGRRRPGWADEVAELTELLAALAPARTLDVACGTAFLTRHLRGEITALDQSPSMVEIARARLPGAEVVLGEAVPLPFDGASFQRLVSAHFYGHLLDQERRRFLGEARRVAAELVIVDSALHEDVEPEVWQQRVLNDGSEHSVYKRYFTGPGLVAELGGGELLHAGRWFVVARA